MESNHGIDFITFGERVPKLRFGIRVVLALIESNYPLVFIRDPS
jgi:hypothetical protein